MVGERDRRPSFDIFVVCSTLIVGGGRPRETKSIFRAWCNRIFCVPVFFRDELRRVSPIFHPFVSDINQGKKEAR